MATNPYFKDYSGEQDLTEDLTIEIIKTMGREMYYIPRDILEKDKIFGEGKIVNYKNTIPIEMYIDSVSGFQGQGDIASKFGIDIKDNVFLTLSKKRFIQEVQSRFPTIKRPREGDLVYFPLSKSIFEINFVEHENPFYQAGKLYTYALTCELTTIDNDEFQTGDTDIDVVETENKASISIFTFSSEISSGKIFYDGETVFQVAGVTGGNYANATAEAKAVKFYSSTDTMEIYGISGSFLYGSQSIRGKDSGAEYYVSGITGSNLIIPVTPVTTFEVGDNEDIKSEGDSMKIYDFTEIDPFSEGTY